MEPEPWQSPLPAYKTPKRWSQAKLVAFILPSINLVFTKPLVPTLAHRCFWHV